MEKTGTRRQHDPQPSMPKRAEQSLAKTFFRLAIANILSNLMVPLAGLVDVAFLGHLDGLHHLGGVALATVLFNYIYWSFGFLRMGTTGLTAQAIGRNDQSAEYLLLVRHGAIALTIGVVIILCQYPLRELGFWLLNAAPDLQASGMAFYNGRIWGAPVTLLNFVLIGWFLGRSQSSRVLLLSIIGNGANVFLDYLFIVRWGWDSWGAGLATAASQYLVTGIALTLFSREIIHAMRTVEWQRLWERSALRSLFILNRDILIRTFFLLSVFALFTNLSADLGTIMLAANTLMLQILTFSAYFIDGFAFATESLAGMFYGQNNNQKSWKLLYIAGAISVITGLLFAASIVLFPSLIFGGLTKHDVVLTTTYRYVGWFVPLLGFGAIAYMLDGYFLGITQSQSLRNASLWASLLGFLPLALLGWVLQNNHILWLGLCSFMLARCIALGRQLLMPSGDPQKL